MHRALTLLLSGAVALSLGCASAPPLPSQTPVSVSAVTGAAQQRITDQVILITDGSGTMYSHRTFPQAKAVTQSLVAALPDGEVRSSRPKPYEAGSIGFGGTERITYTLGAFDRAGLARTASSLRVLGSVDGRGGETPYRHVLSEASSALSGKSGRAALVIVSDGLPDYRDEATASARALVAGYSGDVCIHTVHTGSDSGGAAFLQSLAALSAGCGSSTTADALGSAGALQSFVRTVMMGAAAPVRRAADPCDRVVRLFGVEFAFDKSDISEDSEVVLDVAADQLKECASRRVRVEGHTDFIGSDDYNQKLSERRADAVRSYLQGRGVRNPLDVQGFGESRPIAPGRSDEDRARNRRVELHPVP